MTSGMRRRWRAKLGKGADFEINPINCKNFSVGKWWRGCGEGGCESGKQLPHLAYEKKKPC